MGNDYGAIEGDDIVWKNVIAKQVLYISKNENDSNEVALGSVSYLVKGNKYAYDKAVEWAKAEQKRILKEKGECLSKELMEKMTPFILKQQG